MSQEAVETLEPDVNIGFVDGQYYDLDVILSDIDNVEDFGVVDDLFCTLQSELLDKSDYLKIIQQQNADMKSELNSNKYLTSELEQLQCDEHNTADDLKAMIESKRVELEELHNQQVNNLAQFEGEVQKKSASFMNGPQEYEYESLLEKLVQMKKEVENVYVELSQYKQDLQVSEGKLGHVQNTTEPLFDTSIKLFGESVNDITTLNEELTTAVEQLTNQVNSLQIDSTQRPFI